MAVPKSVIKIKKDGVEYVSNCDRVQYTMHELIRAALRDTGKLICRRTKDNVRKSDLRRKSGRMFRAVQYWVRHKQKTPNLQVGIHNIKKPIGFYLGFYELGTSRHKRYDFLSNAVKDNIPGIIEIQSKYLSALEDEAQALNFVDEKEMIGDDESEN